MPPITLPVAVTSPPVTKFAPVTLPDVLTLELIVVELVTNAVAPTLPAFAFPVTLNVPVIFAPTPETATMFALPALEILTFPLTAGILILLVPLLTPDVLTVPKLRLPAPSVNKYCPVLPPDILTFTIAPKLTLLAFVKLTVPLLARLTRVPILEMLG